MISLLTPTRNRPNELRRMIESACATAANPHNIEILLRHDDDDRTEHAIAPLPCRIFNLSGPRERVMTLNWNQLIPHAKGDIFFCGNDDIEFKTPNWDLLVEAEYAKYPDRILLCGGDDGFVHGRAIPHPFVTRKWCENQR